MGDTLERWMDEEFGERWRDVAEGAEQQDDDSRFPDIREEDVGRKKQPISLAVVERDLPGGLFGFTRKGSSHVVVNSNLYEVDKRRTIRHEKTHHRSPKDELTIRYINGDPEVRNTLSFQANNPARLGRGSRGVSRTAGVSAYAGDGNAAYNVSTNDYL